MALPADCTSNSEWRIQRLGAHGVHLAPCIQVCSNLCPVAGAARKFMSVWQKIFLIQHSCFTQSSKSQLQPNRYQWLLWSRNTGSHCFVAICVILIWNMCALTSTRQSQAAQQTLRWSQRVNAPNESDEEIELFICSDRLQVNTQDHPIMLAEPNIHPRNVRETAVELLFEKFQAPALFLAKNAVLSSFASGRQTSLVIDMGYEASVGTLLLSSHLCLAGAPSPELSIPCHDQCCVHHMQQSLQSIIKI